MIQSYQTTNAGPLTRVTVTSSLSGLIYYNWYLDGQLAGVTQQPSYSFALQPGQQGVVDCIDSNSSAPPSAPAGWPSTRTLLWERSTDATIDRYEVQQSGGGAFSSGFSTGFSGSFTTIGYAADIPSQWSYAFVTGVLADLTNYAWQVVPIDRAGNAGTAIALAAELVVRTPDAPKFAVAKAGAGDGFSGGLSDGFGGIEITFRAA